MNLETMLLELNLEEQIKTPSNKYCRNKKFREKYYKHMYETYDGWNGHPWHNPLKVVPKIYKIKQKEAERKVRRQVVGEENFMMRGCGYHKVYEWRWEVG